MLRTMKTHRSVAGELRRHLVSLILKGDCRDGDLMPSVRSVAAEKGANPLTVARAYQTLKEQGIVQARQGIGFFVAPGGAERLREHEKERFLSDKWPELVRTMNRLDLDVQHLVQMALRGRRSR